MATAYESPFPDQQTLFAVIIAFFKLKDILKMITGVLNDYKLWHSNNLSEFDKDDRPKLAAASTAAFTALRQLFCRKAEFASDEPATAFLKSDLADMRAVVARCTPWCEELLAEHRRVLGGQG